MRQALVSKWHFGCWENNTVVVFLHEDPPDKSCDAGCAGEVPFNSFAQLKSSGCFFRLDQQSSMLFQSF